MQKYLFPFRTTQNREVKPACADGTTSWESRSPPNLKKPFIKYGEGFFGVLNWKNFITFAKIKNDNNM